MLTVKISHAQDSDALAKKHFKQGAVLYDEENFQAALIEFKTSYKYKENWKIRYYIGVTYQALHKFVQAEKELKKYLEEGGDNVPEDKKAVVEEILESLSGVIGSVKINTDTEGALVLLDGKEAGKTPLSKPLRLSVGHYKIDLEKKGYKKYSEEIDLPGGETVTIDAVLEKEKGAEDKPGIKDQEPEPGKKKKKLKPAVFYSMVGVTGALAVGTAVLGGMAMKKHKDFNDTSEEDWQKRQDLRDEGKKFNNAGDIMLGITAAAAVSTVVLIFFTDFKKKEKPKSGLLFSPQWGGANLSFVTNY